MKRKLGPSEAELHLSVAQLLDWLLLPPAFYSTFPSGWGVLSPSMGQRLRKSGLKAGMPDVMVWYESRSFGIELKARGNALTPEQVQTHSKLRAAGVPVYVCRSTDEVIDTLLHEQVPLRSHDRWLQGHRELPLGATYGKRADTIGAEGGKHGTQRTT